MREIVVLIRVILLLLAGPLFLISIGAYIYVQLRFKPDSDELEEYFWEVEDRHPAHIRPLSEVRDDIEKTLLAQERAHLQKQWLDRLKKKTFIRYF